MARLAAREEAMDPREFVERRTKRYMAQTLEEFEGLIEQPISHGRTPSASDIDRVKRTFRKKLQELAGDCLDLMPSDLQINAIELTRS